MDRRIEGAEDRDLTDLVDDLTSEMQSPPMAEAAGALLFSDKMENRMAAEGPPEDHDHTGEQKFDNGHHNAKTSVKGNADDLGWA